MIERILDLDKRLVRTIVTPRPQIQSIHDISLIRDKMTAFTRFTAVAIIDG